MYSYISFLIQAGAEVSEIVPDIDSFTAVQNRLQVLECQPNGRGLLQDAGGLMRGYGFTFSIRGTSNYFNANHFCLNDRIGF